jgi:hypothetical protein
MQQINLNSWAEFKVVIEDIRKKYGYHEFLVEEDKVLRQKNTVLFRGQQYSEWPLETTLERKTNRTYTVSHYLSQSIRLVHELEAITGLKWGIEDLPSIQKEKEERQHELFGPYLPRLDYLLYLRHHGYPSPLLDWSESPYIAAYFAISEVSRSTVPEQRAVVYAYIDSIDSGKSFESGFPIIKLVGPYVSTHKRHFAQKAQYTFATKWPEKDYDFVFCSHHEVFDNPNKFPNQDILIKITLPFSEKNLALKDLDDYNINHFSLFQSDDALIKKLCIKNFDISDF